MGTDLRHGTGVRKGGILEPFQRNTQDQCEAIGVRAESISQAWPARPVVLFTETGGS